MVVYKYFNWSDEARKILTDQELYFVNARKWKKYGEFDFVFPPLDRVATKKYMEKEIAITRYREPDFYWKWLNLNIVKNFSAAYDKLPHLSTIEKELYETQLVDAIIELRLDHMDANPGFYQNQMRTWYFKHTGIFSTSTDSTSPQLWNWKKTFNVSADEKKTDHNVVCVGLNLEVLQKSIGGRYSIGPVKYLDDQNVVEWFEFGPELLVKRYNQMTNSLQQDVVPDIEAQKEIRITKFFLDTPKDKDKSRFVKLPPSCFSEIIIHKKADPEVKKQVDAIANSLNISKRSEYED